MASVLCNSLFHLVACTNYISAHPKNMDYGGLANMQITYTKSFVHKGSIQTDNPKATGCLVGSKVQLHILRQVTTCTKPLTNWIELEMLKAVCNIYITLAQQCHP